MRKLLFLLIFTLFLGGCSNQNITITHEYLVCYQDSVLAINYSTNAIEEVYVYYDIEDFFDSFYLYTIHQNYLPVGFISYGTPNVSLLNAYSKDDTVYYEVDSFISLCYDFSKFHNLLSRENEKLGYSNTIILFNGKEYLEIRQ